MPKDDEKYEVVVSESGEELLVGPAYVPEQLSDEHRKIRILEQKKGKTAVEQMICYEVDNAQTIIQDGVSRYRAHMPADEEIFEIIKKVEDHALEVKERVATNTADVVEKLYFYPNEDILFEYDEYADILFGTNGEATIIYHDDKPNTEPLKRGVQCGSNARRSDEKFTQRVLNAREKVVKLIETFRVCGGGEIREIVEFYDEYFLNEQIMEDRGK